MITQKTINWLESKTAASRKDAVRRLGQGVPFSYITVYLNGCDAIEEIYQDFLRRQLPEGGDARMKKKKLPSKLKLAKTAKAKKAIKAKK